VMMASSFSFCISEGKEAETRLGFHKTCLCTYILSCRIHCVYMACLIVIQSNHVLMYCMYVISAFS